ncbi:MAG: sugar ABC transporter ATP-binding protein, partial [Thermomicrobiales bacterium]
MSSEAPPLLRMVGISKNFGGSDVLSDVNFDLLGGEVHALMGENGAGKSTLMRILAGVHWAHRGQIYLDGKEESIDSPRAAKALGIAIIHQELSVVPDMSVAENLALGQEPRKWAGSLDRRRVVEDARVKLATVNASFNPNTAMRDLSVGQQQLVEIARASSSNARILILDEPTAALSAAEAQTLFALIRQMREQGMGLILISHRLDEVWSLSDRLTVLRDGRLVSVTERATITPGDVVRQMVGRDIEDLFGRGERDAGQAVLEVEDLTNGSDIGPVSLQVRAGEVVGMFGLIGAGRTELVRLIFGADPSRGGVIRVSGKVTRPRTPHIAIKDRIGLLPESRKEQGLFLEMSIRDNVAISSLKRFSRFGSLLQRPLAESVSRRMKQLRISV